MPLEATCLLAILAVESIVSEVEYIREKSVSQGRKWMRKRLEYKSSRTTTQENKPGGRKEGLSVLGYLRNLGRFREVHPNVLLYRADVGCLRPQVSDIAG